jgi:hypothetical protein
MYFLMVGQRPGHAADLVGGGPPRLAAGFLPGLGDAPAPIPSRDRGSGRAQANRVRPTSHRGLDRHQRGNVRIRKELRKPVTRPWP